MKFFYIDKLIRDDSKIFEFDRNNFYLDEENDLVQRAELNTTSINYTDISGGEMIYQTESIFEQPINGLFIGKTKDYWDCYRELATFFQINHRYKIIYKTISGQSFARNDCWISENLQIKPMPREDYSTFTVSMGVGNVDLYEYIDSEENPEETYVNSLEIGLLNATTGGQVWDSRGQKWDSIGSVWEGGNGGLREINVKSTKTIYPHWFVIGPVKNPTLTNNTTGTKAVYNGSVDEGQTLIIDFRTGKATIDGSLVTKYVTGYVKFKPGLNTVGYSSDSDGELSIIKWNNVVG